MILVVVLLQLQAGAGKDIFSIYIAKSVSAVACGT